MKTFLAEALGAKRDIPMELSDVTIHQKVFMASIVALFMIAAMFLIATT